MAKSVSKRYIKQLVADYFESDAIMEYNAAQMRASGAAMLLVDLRRLYNDALDRNERAVALKAAILKGYDPKRHLRITKNVQIPRGERLAIFLGNGAPEQRQIRVALGGQAARTTTSTLLPKDPKPQPAMTYAVVAEGLRDDGAGGLILECHVDR